MNFISAFAGFVLSVAVVLAIFRLFSIDTSLKRVVRQLDDLNNRFPSSRQNEKAAPDKCP
jgi:hypothetical protein